MAVQMRRWTISRRWPLWFKPPEMIACTLRVIIAASHCGPQEMGSRHAAWHSTSMPDVLCQVEWPGLKCSAGGRRGKKPVSRFKMDIASLSYLASSAAWHPRMSGGQGFGEIFSSPAPSLHVPSLHSDCYRS